MVSNTQKVKRIKKEGAEKIYEDDKWLVVRPFTLEASKLYGAETQWCTTSETAYSSKRGFFFKTYIKEGCLYYIIDKKKESGKLNKVLHHLTWCGREEVTDDSNSEIEDTNTPSHLKDLIYANWITHLTRDKVEKQSKFKVSVKGLLTEHIRSYMVKCSIIDTFWTALIYLLILSPYILIKRLHNKGI